jgi:hypothetical protein
VLLGYPLAVKARSLALLGALDEAREVAASAFALTERLGGFLNDEVMPALVAAELHDRSGDHDAARRMLFAERARIAERAARFEARDAELRDAYLARTDVAQVFAVDISR